MPTFDEFFKLDISTSVYLTPTEPGDYMPAYCVNIMAVNESNEFVFAGKARFYKTVSLEEIDSLHDVFDSTNDDLADLMNILDDDGNLHTHLEDTFGEIPLISHVFYLHTIEILPEFRKTGLAKAVIEKLIDVFASEKNTIIFLTAAPMNKTLSYCDDHGPESCEWNKDMEYPKMSKKTASAKKKLMKKYQKELGFRPTGVREIMYRFRVDNSSLEIEDI